MPMPRRLLALCLALPALPCAAADILAADGISLPPQVSTYLAGQAKLERIYVSSLVRGDINGDGQPDVFVSYSVQQNEGGNLAQLHQALFLAEKGQVVFKAGRDNGSAGMASGSSFSAEYMEAGRIVGQTLTYAPDDGACCPSLKAAAVIRYENGKLGAPGS